jgi:hypothetical protein
MRSPPRGPSPTKLAPHKVRAFQGELLRNHPPEGETQYVDRVQANCTTESNAMLRHLHDGVRRFSSRSCNASIVKQNDFVIGCEAIRYRRIPTIHIRVEVFQKE